MIIKGLEALSSIQIEDKSNRLLNYFNAEHLKRVQATPLLKIVDFLRLKHNIRFEFGGALGFNESSYKILGACNPKKRIILIDCSLSENTSKFNFTLAHELGHLALHRNLEIKYSEKEDGKNLNIISENSQNGKKKKTDIDWMEWQANQYASSLLMPMQIFRTALIIIQEELGLSKRGTIFIDEQQDNQITFFKILSSLSLKFGVSKTAVQIRLNTLKLINDKRKGFYDLNNLINQF